MYTGGGACPWLSVCTTAALPAAAAFLRFRRLSIKIPRPANARRATPPIAPPTIGPTGVDFLAGIGESVVNTAGLLVVVLSPSGVGVEVDSTSGLVVEGVDVIIVKLSVDEINTGVKTPPIACPE